MTKFLVFFLIVCVGVFAENWRDHWIKGVELCEKDRFKEAENEFRNAVISDNVNSYVFVDLGKCCYWNKKSVEALTWLNKALDDNNLDLVDRLRALNARFLVYYDLGMKEEAIKDMDDFREMNPAAPKFEIEDENMIIRNVPKDPLFKYLVRTMYPAAGLCQSENDIRFMDGGVCVIRLKPKCEECTSCGSLVEKEACQSGPIAPPAPPLIPSVGKPIPSPNIHIAVHF